jgi:hypothetical protein
MKDFFAFLEEKKVAVIVGYIVFFVVFFLINIPKMSFFGYLLAFVVVTLFYLICVYAIKKIWFDKK